MTSGCAPNRDRTGIWRVSEAHSASMVWTRTRSALSSRHHPRSSLRTSAARARSQVRAAWPPSGRGSWRARRSASNTRWRISAAALMVKVIAAISSGCFTPASSARKRWIRSSVFPEPAGACTMQDRRGSRARSRWAASATRASLIGRPIVGGGAEWRLLVDAAEHRLVAQLAGVALARVHSRIARGEAAAGRLEDAAPALEELFPVAVALRGRAILLDDVQSGQHARRAAHAHEFQVSRLEARKGHRGYLATAAQCVHRQLRIVGPLAEPRGHLAVSGLVVDDRVRAVGEAIEPIEP